MSNPKNNNVYMNQTEANMYLNNPNAKPAFVPVQNPVYVPVVPVQGTPVGMPVQQQQAPMMVPTQSVNNSQQVVIIEDKKSNNKGCCYMRGPRQSPCGCLDPNKDYCCFLVVGAYILMSLRYILMCLCIWSYCRSFNRGGWC